jgi:AcrR family transcriptional regulator
MVEEPEDGHGEVPEGQAAEPSLAEASSPEAPPDEASAAEPSRKWRRRKDARPEELITSALQLFAERGFAKTSLKDVGKKAGVSKATVYLYFKNKEDLLLAAVQKSVVPILDFADDYEIDSDASASEMIRTLMHRWIDEFAERSLMGLPKLVMAESANFPALGQLYVDAVLQRARRLFQRILKRGVGAGEFREIDVREVVHVLLAPLLHAQIHSESLGPHDPTFPDLHAFLDTHVDLFLAAIRS